MSQTQDKEKEIEFFDLHAGKDEYNVFTSESNQLFVNSFSELTSLLPDATVVDLGCGSGVFTDLLRRAGYHAIGIDISPKLIEVGRKQYPGLELAVGDAECLPFKNGSVDGVLLSGLVHHFTDPSRLAAEVYRILRPGGRFMAFDPNRRNPFMYLYRDRSSPFYSPIGVTQNERPVLAEEAARVFREAGFEVHSDYLAGLAYRYVASSRAQRFLSIYNRIDSLLFTLPALRIYRPFVLTSGIKPARST